MLRSYIHATVVETKSYNRKTNLAKWFNLATICKMAVVFIYVDNLLTYFNFLLLSRNMISTIDGKKLTL